MNNLSLDKKLVNSLGHLVKVLRAERKMSQKALADAAKVGVASVARLESGRSLNRSTLENIARALDTTSESLIARASAEKQQAPKDDLLLRLERIEEKLDRVLRKLGEEP